MKKTSEFPGIRKKNEKKEKKRKSKNQIRCESSSAEVAQVAEAPLILSLLKKPARAVKVCAIETGTACSRAIQREKKQTVQQKGLGLRLEGCNSHHVKENDGSEQQDLERG